MTAPALKAAEWLKLLDMDVAVSDFELRRVARESKNELARGVGPDEARVYHAVLSVSYWRLGDSKLAFDHARRASVIAPNDIAHCNQMAVALLELDRADEALGVLLTALKLPKDGVSDVILYGNLAEAFYRTGDAIGARECSEKMISKARRDSQRDQIAVANQLAELGESARALEFFARYLSLARERDVFVAEAAKCELNDHEEAVLMNARGLRRLVANLRKFGFRETPATFRPERDGSDAVTLMGETASSVARANSTIFG
ncbi:MAG TPA: hypothetical protein VGM44_01560 [Polyangiaceae bacterium]|jgi:tetratricopeptide (TPR) repeat protein